MSEELFHAMAQCVLEGDADKAAELAQQALAQGIAPLDAINNGFVLGVNEVGRQYAAGDMFLPDLVMAGEAMKAAVAVLEPEMQRTGTERKMLGKVVLGTVKGDIHEIGKTLVGTMLTANGFQVFDLGTDVPTMKFVDKAREVNADIVGLSALLTTTMTGQREVIRSAQRSRPKRQGQGHGWRRARHAWLGRRDRCGRLQRRCHRRGGRCQEVDGSF